MPTTKKQVTIIASNHCLFSGIAGPMDMFLQAGVVWNYFRYAVFLELFLDPFHQAITREGVQFHPSVEEEVDLLLRGTVLSEVQAGLVR